MVIDIITSQIVLETPFTALEFFNIDLSTMTSIISTILKWSGSFFKTNTFIVAYTLVSPKKYFAKNLKL